MTAQSDSYHWFRFPYTQMKTVLKFVLIELLKEKNQENEYQARKELHKLGLKIETREGKHSN